MCGDLSPVAMDAIVPGENCILDIPSKLTECDLLIVFVDVKNIMKEDYKCTCMQEEQVPAHRLITSGITGAFWSTSLVI
jgi:hypothetical protein